MNYTKPEIKVLGDASKLIERIPQKDSQVGDSGHNAPAYDLDD